MLACLVAGSIVPAQAQTSDTLRDEALRGVTISGYRMAEQRIERLPDVHQAYLLAGKKNEVVRLDGMNANLAEKSGRQVFAKVPGVFVYDMDGSGNQLNISTRGLDPHRSWELNVRHNGILTNSDMYGYPASHFSAPLESIERVEIIRGSGALQYGAQFGGLVNYVSKTPDTTRALGFENQTAVGSFGLFASYNAVGGKIGRVQYNAYYYRRVSDGYRDNSRSDGEAYFAQLSWQLRPGLHLRAEMAHSGYQYQLPGPLTDAQFAENPRQSTRARNYYEPRIWVPSVTLDWALGPRTRLWWTNSALYGARNSVLFDRFATVKDSINAATGAYNPRQVDIDHFASHTSELRLMHRYRLGAREQVLLAGVQYLHNDMHRRQQGKGTTGTDYDLTLTDPTWGRDLYFRTRNTAFFVENTFYLGARLALSPGFRVELGQTRATGSIVYYNPEEVPNTIRHRFPLLGVSARYALDDANQLYAGWSQAYRPVIFKDIIPASVLERADKDLENARGYTAEWGLRGNLGSRLRYDLGGFYLLYRNRLGNLLQTDPASGETFIYKTNIGDSRTWGAELFGEWTLLNRRHATLSLFSSTSFFDARYRSAQVVNNGENQDLRGKRVEGVPDWMSRNGIQAGWRWFSLSLQYSYVGRTFADALNTAAPSANGARGLVPAYSLVDLHLACRFAGRYTLRLSANNLTDEQYFTKRPTFYPGPGIWPSDGRSLQLSLGFRL